MELFHDRPRPRPAPLEKVDEEECFTHLGRRMGVWLTATAPEGGDQVVSVLVEEADVLEHEVTAPGDDVRTFVVPFPELARIGDRRPPVDRGESVGGR